MKTLNKILLFTFIFLASIILIPGLIFSPRKSLTIIKEGTRARLNMIEHKGTFI